MIIYLQPDDKYGTDALAQITVADGGPLAAATQLAQC